MEFGSAAVTLALQHVGYAQLGLSWADAVTPMHIVPTSPNLDLCYRS
jgi:hypothetical protein